MAIDVYVANISTYNRVHIPSNIGPLSVLVKKYIFDLFVMNNLDLKITPTAGVGSPIYFLLNCSSATRANSILL